MSELMSGGCGAVLLIEADASTRALLERALSREDSRLDLAAAASAAEALALLGTTRPDLVIAARTLPDADMLDLIERIRHIHDDLPVWIVDSQSSDGAAAAHEAMRAGATDYFTLDPTTLAKLPFRVSKAVARARLPLSRVEAERTERCRDLACIAHDLRSPLAGLAALVDLLEGEVDGPLTMAQRQRVTRIRAAVDRVAGVAATIADLAQMEAGRLTLSRGPIELEEITREIRRGVEPLLSSRGVGLQIFLPPDLPRLQGDSFRIRQMIASLVTVMLKHVEGTTVELVAVSRGSMVEVTLREASRGIPVEALPPAFTQVESAGGDTAAAAEPATLHGVAFALARGLAQLHGGSLRIGRDLDGGLLASLTLPAEPPDAMPHADRAQDIRKTT